MNRRWVPLLLGASLLAAVPAGAQPGKEKREEKREERKEKREEKREERQEKREERREDRQEKREDRQERRQERRKDRRDKIKAKWGDLHKHPAVREELRRHARRMARLNRILALAEEAKKDDVVKRVKDLIAKEEARHDKRMTALKDKGGQP
jgi:hypothetical protein